MKPEPAFMSSSKKSLTSLSRDQLIHIVRTHEERGSCSLFRPEVSPPRIAKKAKLCRSEQDNDDLEGFLAKAKAEFGVAATAASNDDNNNDLSSPLRAKDDDLAIPTTCPRSWTTRPSRSFRSFASSCGGSTAAELDCLVSVATPPGLLRNTTNSSVARPGNPQLAMMEEEDDDSDFCHTDYDTRTKQFSC